MYLKDIGVIMQCVFMRITRNEYYKYQLLRVNHQYLTIIIINKSVNLINSIKFLEVKKIFFSDKNI